MSAISSSTAKPNIPWLVVVGTWLLVGFGYGSQTYFDMQAEVMGHVEKQYSFWRIVAWGVSYGLIWCLLSVPILLAGYKYPLERPVAFRSILAHVGGIVVTCLLATGARLGLLYPINPFGKPPPVERLGEFFPSVLRSSATPYVFVYILLASLGTMMAYRQRVRERELESTRLEAMLAQAEVSSLRSQLHPHFLFNTLNGIAGLVRTGENETAAQMISELSQLLRRSLDEFGKPEISLTEEIDFLRLYLDIEHMRFPDRLKVALNIDPSATRAKIPSLLLQPIVENAIRHAVATKVAATTIRVYAKVDDGKLTITVTDDGPGLPDNFDPDQSTGIGIANSRDRLRAL